MSGKVFFFPKFTINHGVVAVSARLAKAMAGFFITRCKEVADMLVRIV